MATLCQIIFMVIYMVALGLALALGLVFDVSPATAANSTGLYYVTDYGAVGDGMHDDTTAFQAAIDAAATNGGMVLVPLVGGGRGYVLTSTIYIKRGVALIGSLAGFTNNGTAAYTLPESHVMGPKIFARPLELRRPLFQMETGSTVRGFWILYDQQPWPTDQEFQDQNSPYYYASFADAKANFIRDYVKAYGPTFYLPWGNNVVVEDIMADRYYDFFFLKGGAKIKINRLSLYGYNRAFVIQESFDVNVISDVNYVPNVGPATPGPVLPGMTYSWIYGIIVSQPSNVGLQIGISDGYVFDSLFFYGVHTAIRLGASENYPIYDPVEDTTWIPPGPAQGPWGQMSNIAIDLANVGFHFVWPSHLSNRVSNLQIFTGFDDEDDFDASTGTGSLTDVGKQAAFLFEPTFSKSNNLSLIPTVMANNVMIASFQVPDRFSLAAADAFTANGRVFLVAGDVTMEIFGFLIDWPYNDLLIIAAAGTAGDVSIKIRGYVHNGNPGTDKKVDKNGLVPLALCGDTSGDGTISAYDATLILQYVVGLIDQFPATNPIGQAAQKYIAGEITIDELDRILQSFGYPSVFKLLGFENQLLQNYPNPFNPETWIPFKLAQDTPVTINIYDTKGQLIRTIALGNRNAGIYTTEDKAAYWDGRDRLGNKVASGVYFYTLQAGEYKATRKMVIVK